MYQFHSDDIYPSQTRAADAFFLQQIEEDPMIGQLIKAIFIKYEPIWNGVDHAKSGFVIDPMLYFQLKEFLFTHFKLQQTPDSDQVWCSSIQNALTKQNEISKQMSSGSRKNDDEGIEQNIQAIPGGRYGCAQFIKICGPPILSKLSLGRLAQMIQQAVQDDLLRYHKTLLVWTNKISTQE